MPYVMNQLREPLAYGSIEQQVASSLSQQQALQKQVPIAPSNNNNSSGQPALVSSQSHASLLSGNLRQAELKAAAAINRQQAKQQPLEIETATANQIMSAPTTTTTTTTDSVVKSLLAKSGSNSSVLSSVSLASGVQMRQNHGLATDKLSPGAVVKQSVEDSNSTSGQSSISGLLATSCLSELNENAADIDADDKTSAKQRDKEDTLAPTSEAETGSGNLDATAAAAANDEVAPDLQLLPPTFARDPQIQTPKPRITELKRLLEHTNSLNELPEFGIETDHEEELAQLMDQIDVWGLDIFEVHSFSHQHSLTAVMYKIFKVRLT